MRLQPLTLHDKATVDCYAQRTAPQLSAYRFAPLYVWREHFQFYWRLIAGYLCVFAKQGADYFMPILPMPYEPENRGYRNVIETVSEFMVAANPNPQIARIENVPQGALAFFEDSGVRPVWKENEYLYETAALGKLRGNRFKSKRNAYNVFRRQHPAAALTPYCRADSEGCLRCYEAWHTERAARGNDDLYRAMLDDSRSAHRIAIAHAEALGLTGHVVRIHGDIRGYTFGYPLNTETFCVLFEVADLSVKGLAQFIYREVCKTLIGTYRWVNATSDSGLPTLERVKRSYRPAQLLPSYTLYF